MSKQPAPAHRTGMSLGVGVVGVLAGLLFATNASLFASDSERQPVDLEGLLRAEDARLAETNAQVLALQSEVEDLLAEQGGADPADGLNTPMELAAARSAVSGAGVTVSLTDSPLIHDIPEEFDADDLLVHQQDLEAVINALWAGGAEAVSVQGHRLGPLSDVRCVGNVLLVDGSTYSPPYVISAIGDAQELRAGLDDSHAVRVYREWVERARLGYSVEDEDSLEMRRYQGGLSMEYARIPGDEPITWNPAAAGGDE
ncbi:DUF881 domain-containing protein [Ruania halotolerans]|uniref:DUF881 domain-containing protein n=1 Tax=Ruania halotolerans TaxID=2897773 RepID=UPI001E4FB9A9|nr:DUF881 domain-containing protein [Ruania halotolerans]UFU06634.1 DUF881 domain-containing protein [Ruania halotolerans]